MSDKPTYLSLDLLRHGQLEKPGVFCASSQAPLSEIGLSNLLNTTQSGSWDVIISSPQKRCLSFAKKLAQKKQCELIVEKRFKEMNFGDWVDLKSEDLWKKYPDDYQQLWESPDTFVAPNGEAMQDFYARVKEGLDDLLARNSNKAILLVTHGGVIRTILANALDISTTSILKFSIAYAQMSRLHCYPDGHFSLQFLGKDG